MTFDPHFRFYSDGHAPTGAAPDDAFWPALRRELGEEMERRRASYPKLVSKGRMNRDTADRELRVWRAIAASVAAIPATGVAPATWSEMVHALRREIALRRKFYPQWILDRAIDADDAERKLSLVEAWHDYLWHDCGGAEGAAARAERLHLLDRPRAA